MCVPYSHSLSFSDSLIRCLHSLASNNVCREMLAISSFNFGMATVVARTLMSFHLKQSLFLFLRSCFWHFSDKKSLDLVHKVRPLNALRRTHKCPNHTQVYNKALQLSLSLFSLYTFLFSVAEYNMAIIFECSTPECANYKLK